MENQFDSINIEKNKELFEYEMTEVILKLKGEFSAFSGNDIRIAEILINTDELCIRTPEMVTVKVEESNIKIPEIGDITSINPLEVNVKEFDLKLPVLTKITDEDIRKKEVKFKKEDIDVWQGITLPSIPVIKNLPILKIPVDKSDNVKVPYVVKCAPVCINECITSSSQTVKVPEINFNGNTLKVIPDIQCEPVLLDYPEIQTCGTIDIKGPVIQMDMKPIELQQPHSFKIEIKNLIVKNDEVTIPEIKNIQLPEIENVHITMPPISVPDILIISVKAIPEIQIMPVQISVPDIIVKEFSEISIILEKIHMEAIHIPDVVRPVMKPIEVKDVLKTSIQIPAVKKPELGIEIPVISIESAKQIEIPQKPEDKEIIENIILLHWLELTGK